MFRLLSVFVAVLGWMLKAQEPAGEYDALKQKVSSSVETGKFADAQRYLQQAIELRQSDGDLLLSEKP